MATRFGWAKGDETRAARAKASRLRFLGKTEEANAVLAVSAAATSALDKPRIASLAVLTRTPHCLSARARCTLPGSCCRSRR